jgi:hypothetical protein
VEKTGNEGMVLASVPGRETRASSVPCFNALSHNGAIFHHCERRHA